MSTADHSPTVRRARELFSLQKWPHADHDLHIMWAHSDLDYNDGLFSSLSPARIMTLGAGLGKVTTRPKMKG
jgi:acyl carrier protein phosphodiesterase